MKLLRRLGLILLLLLVAAPPGVGIYFTNKAMFPDWRVMLDECPERRLDWGKACGDVRKSAEFAFRELRFPGAEPLNLETPAWFLPAAENRGRAGAAPATAFRGRGGQWAAVFIHGGGADRREGYRYARYWLSRGIDYYMPDAVCHGEAACASNKALSFGARESETVKNVYRTLRPKVAGLILMGTSVGANSILIALRELPDVNAVVAENPMYSAEQFVLDTKAAPGFFPRPYRRFLFWMTAWRADFAREMNPADRLQGQSATPIYFLHGREDDLTPFQHSEMLHAAYAGPKQLWIAEGARHARLWNLDNNDYERRLDEFLKRYALPPRATSL